MHRPAGLDTGLGHGLLDIASSRTFADLGSAFQNCLQKMTGGRSLGIYSVTDRGPRLKLSFDVPHGFLTQYDAEYGRTCPLLQATANQRRAVAGVEVVGSRNWKKSGVYSLLRDWGFYTNMCGPLFVEGEFVALVYTSTRSPELTYGSSMLEQMDLLCRAGSMALSRILDQPDRGQAPASGLVSPHEASPNSALPPRAHAVAAQLCRGGSNKDIARALRISENTVKEHIASLCRRFRVRNRTELVAVCCKNGLDRIEAVARLGAE